MARKAIFFMAVLIFGQSVVLTQTSLAASTRLPSLAGKVMRKFPPRKDPVNAQIEEAKRQLLEEKDPIMAGRILDKVLKRDPYQPKACFWKSIVSLASNPQIIAKLKECGILDQDLNFVGEYNGIWGDRLSLDMLQDMSIVWISDLNEVDVYLSRIKTSFTDQVEVTGGNVIAFDFGDAMIIRSAIGVLRFIVWFQAGYTTAGTELDVNATRDISLQSFLEQDYLFGELGKNVQVMRQKSKDALVDAFSAYMTASHFIRQRGDQGIEHFFQFFDPMDINAYYDQGSWEKRKHDGLDREARLYSVIEQLYENLVGRSEEVSFKGEDLTTDDLWLGKSVSVNLNKFFNSKRSLKEWNDLLVSGLHKGMILDHFDAEFDGVFPDMRPEDWNAIWNKGVTLWVSVWSDEEAYVSLWLSSWNVPDNLETHINKVTIFRAETPDRMTGVAKIKEVTRDDLMWPSAWDGQVEDRDALSLCSSTGEYYYWAETQYDFGEGKTAITYSPVRKLNASIAQCGVLDIVHGRIPGLRFAKRGSLRISVDSDSADAIVMNAVFVDAQGQNPENLRKYGASFYQVSKTSWIFSWRPQTRLVGQQRKFYLKIECVQGQKKTEKILELVVTK